jgi:hypothetical protein
LQRDCLQGAVPVRAESIAADKQHLEAAQKESAAEKVAREKAAAARAAERAAAVAGHHRLARTWPAALYHYDYEPRQKTEKVMFVVEASLPNILQAERSRMLLRCGSYPTSPGALSICHL